MSDTDQEILLQVSEETLEEKTFEKFLSQIRDGAIYASESGDFLSYSTLLDLQLSEPSQYTIDEREQLLVQLLEILSSDTVLVCEIGWDIPSLILPFVESDHSFETPIRSIPCVDNVLKLFEVLALHGNAKELFLKSNELMSELKLTIEDANRHKAIKLFEVKLYCLFELLTSCLRRVHTLYPSRFLSMTVSSFINILYVNPPVTMIGVNFLIERVYKFARNYTRPPLPESVSEDEQTLKKINDDEEFLQRKLLTSFITESINLICKHEMLGLSLEFLKELQDQLSEPLRYTSEYTFKLPINDKLYELCQSFDMDLQKVFVDVLASTKELITFPSESTSEDTYRIQLFEKLVVDFQKKFAITIVDGDANELKDSAHGSIALFAYHYCTTKSRQLKITITEAMLFGLRVMVPGLVHKLFTKRGLQDLAVFWMWVAIDQTEGGQNAIEHEIAEIPTVLLSTYLQCLMFTLVLSFKESYFRFVTITLITRILCCAPEDTAYKLIINSLQECPYENVKAALVQVLKSLLLKERFDSKLPKCFGILSLADNKATNPVPLPPREIPKSPKYIILTSKRFAEICALVDLTIEATFQKDTLDAPVFPTLQAYLNLLIVVKGSECAESARISSICEDLNKKIAHIKSASGVDPLKTAINNAADMLAVSVERLSGGN